MRNMCRTKDRLKRISVLFVFVMAIRHLFHARDMRIRKKKRGDPPDAHGGDGMWSTTALSDALACAHSVVRAMRRYCGFVRGHAKNQNECVGLHAG